MSEPKRPRRSRHFTAKAANPELSETITAVIASLKDFPNPEVVIGNGWAAMLAVGLLATKRTSDGLSPNVLWITNSGARAIAPLPLLESGLAANAWRELVHRLGVSVDEPQSGHYLREFRHRSFARAAWHKTPTRESRESTRNEWLWGPETRITPVFEARFEESLAELDEKARARIEAMPNVKILSGVPVAAFEGESLRLASGETIAFRRAIWADRWTGLGAIEGLPKGGALARNREPMGILQAVFTHSASLAGSSMQEAFFGSTHKDAGEEFNRNIWGSFFEDGKKSVWTIFITGEEAADNHTIGKKYRRLRQALDRMFTGTEWLPEGAKDFSATLVKEEILFQEDFVFAKGEPVTEAPVLGGVTFVTDAFGPSVAAELVARSLGAELGFDLVAMSEPVMTSEVVGEDSAEALDQGGAETEHENVQSNADRESSTGSESSVEA
ncbi:MAG: hypothetical protein JST04_05455 [Bdellovibrionales bacterium]|nr:hypothetical protein [Bdellovibrionales bacterium]